MNITENLVIQKRTTKFNPDPHYVLFIYNYGPVGDKLNVGPSSTGKNFPLNASSEIETIEEAMKAYNGFIAYVESRIQDGLKKGKKKEEKRPSYCLWT